MKFINKSLFAKEKSKLIASIHGYGKQPLKYFLITSLVLITSIKLSLIGNGFMALIDESVYYCSGKALQDVKNLMIVDAIDAVFSAGHRPADAMIKTIPHALQFISADIFKLQWYESKNSYPLFIYNFVVFCLILIVHFKFSKRILKDNYLALISVIFFSSMTNSYLYLRHAQPYDLSLLIFYFITYESVVFSDNDRLSFKKSFLFGAFSFFGYLVYPGYFPLYIISLFFFFFYKLTKEIVFKKAYNSCVYVLGGLFCLIIFESISRIGGHSYIREAIQFSSTITQGDFEQSFSFIIKYLFEVEGVTGIIMLLGLALFCFIIIYQTLNKTHKQDSLLVVIGIAVIGVFLVYACVGYFMHKMIFYGRLLHMYFPFFCIFTLFSLDHFTKTIKKRQLVFFFITIVFVTNFGVNFIHYKSFAYPRDIFWKYSKANKLQSIDNICESDYGWSVIPTNEEKIHSPKIIIVNGCYVYPFTDISGFRLFIPPDGYYLLESKSHFINFKAYQYEGFSIIERRNIDKLSLQIKIFSKGDLQ